jgi:hypothetical protein
MKILITETHHNLIRRIGRVENKIGTSLMENDPCEYSRYEQYRRVVINNAILMMTHDEDQTSHSFDNLSASDIFNFRDRIIPLFDEKIRDHYDSTDCSEDSEIMSESLWFRRRGIQLDDSEYITLMKDIIAEGFDYTDVCDYDYNGGFKDFLHEILEGSSVTFVNTFPEFTRLDDPQINHIDNYIYSFMSDKFGNLIEKSYHDRLELCNED